MSTTALRTLRTPRLRAARTPASALHGIALATLVLGSSASALAQTSAPPNKLDAVVVTATRSPQQLADVIADVTVLTRADIERQALGTLADLLRGQACFEIARTGGPGAQTSLFVRGAETRHTTVLIDGVRFDSQASSGASWNAIPLAQIERVEIIRGPGAAVYGSDAVGGVVQVFTRKAQGQPQLEVATGLGSLNTQKAELSAFGLTGGFDYALSLSHERSDGYNARPVADPSFVADDDGYRTTSGSARLGLQLSPAQRVEFVGLKNRMDAQYDASARPRGNDLTRNDMRAGRLAWSARWDGGVTSELSVGESGDRYRILPNVYTTETRVRSYAAHLSLPLGGGRLNTLLERREDELINSTLPQSPTPGSATRHQNAVGAGYLWSLGGWQLQAHGRHDDDSEYGGQATGSLAAAYRLNPQWRVHGTTGTAFRAPNLYQRFSPYGNPKLAPESGRNLEAGLDYERGTDSVSLVAYRNRVSNLIVFGAANAALCPDPFGCYENASQALLQGLSLRGATRLDGLRLSGSVDAQSPKNLGAGSVYGKLLARRAKLNAKLRADTTLGGWDLGAELLASGHRFDNASNSVRLGGYVVVNLEAQLRLRDDLKLQLKLDNPLDRGYQYANGYATHPRQAFAGLRWTLK